MIASLFLTARGEAFPKVIDQSPSEEIAGHLDDTPDDVRSGVLEKVVLHRGHGMRRPKSVGSRGIPE